MITNEQARVAALASHVAYGNSGAYVGLISSGYEYARDVNNGYKLIFGDPKPERQ